MSNYWEKRILRNEAKAQRNAANAVKRQKKLYKDAFKEIETHLESLALELLESGRYGQLSRSELWQVKKYVDLENLIGTLLQDVSGQQINITTDLLRQVFEETIGDTLEGLMPKGNVAYSILNQQQVDQVLNTAWSGKHYSQRIYGNNSKIAERIKKDMTDMIVLGKDTTKIKKKLINDLGVSYHYADRLVRTEASHIYNEAARKAYEQAKVEYIEIIGTDDEKQCPICGEYQGMKYRTGTQPRLPVHPCCRCCYAPVVDLKNF